MRARSRSPVLGVSRRNQDRRPRENRPQVPDANAEMNAKYVSALKELSDNLDSAVSRSQYSYEQVALTTDSLSKSFAYLKDTFQRARRIDKDFLEGSIKRCLEAVRALAIEHRESHIYISRLGKSIESTLTTLNLPKIGESEFPLPEHKQFINMEIVHYLIARGLDTVLPHFQDESNVIEDRFLKEKIEDVRIVIREIKETNPYPVFDWVERQDNEFDYSDLLFKLHKIVFRQLAMSDGQLEAVKYAQGHFPQFAPAFSKDIGTIMASMILVQGINVFLYDLHLWEELKAAFLKAVSKVFRYSDDESQLQTVVDAGCEALPAILEIQERLNGAPQSLTYNVKCLTNHHSLFSCPILKEISTEENPPMRLRCGHAISKNALDRLVSNQRLKCPYCPVFQRQSEAKRIYL